MNEKDFADMIRLARRAPLQNMDEAEAVAELLQRYAFFVKEYIESQNQPNDSEETE